MLNFITDALTYILVGLFFAGLFATYKFFRWWKALRPSRLLGALTVMAVVIDIASTPLMYLAYRRIFLPESPRFEFAVVFLGISLIILLGVKIIEMYLFRDLDYATPGSSDPTVETRDQREDREFGEQRRALEVTHGEDTKDANS